MIVGRHITLALLAVSAWVWPARSRPVDELDVGFERLYQLRPAESREAFAAWQVAHPDDPFGSAAEAASLLFEECYRQGVLTSEYFLDDDRFLGKVALTPDPELREAFFAAEQRAQTLARRQLTSNPNDPNALYAMTLSLGMQADYAALIEKHQIDSLAMIRDANAFATRLLGVRPDAADAYLTLGVANYVIGSLPALMRFVLRFKGIRGDKTKGLTQLEMAATHGQYMQPFAKIMLALAALRENHVALARVQLLELVGEFPENPIFVTELAKIDPAPRSGGAPP